jgi:hypothetical protein
LLSFFHLENQRTGGQKKFCPEAWDRGGDHVRSDVTLIMYTHESNAKMILVKTVPEIRQGA